jgi:hypothetical protein
MKFIDGTLCVFNVKDLAIPWIEGDSIGSGPGVSSPRCLETPS